MWVRIIRERRFMVPNDQRVWIHYTVGLEISIKRAWGEALIRDGDAVAIPTPARAERW